jgi:poly(3-hydroxybutyrate) depolymerase
VQPDNTTKDSWDASSDDDAIRAFLDSLIAELGIDRNRVHMGGFSQGGWMTWRFVCNHADLIASAAPIGAGASFDDEAGFGFSCDFEVGALPTAEVDVVYVHGTDDPDIPCETAVQQRDLMVEAWEMEGPEIVMETADLRWSRWASTTGTVLEFIEHDWVGGMLGGHCYPGSGATHGCGEDTDIHYADVAISFYLAHPKDE